MLSFSQHSELLAYFFEQTKVRWLYIVDRVIYRLRKNLYYIRKTILIGGVKKVTELRWKMNRKIQTTVLRKKWNFHEETMPNLTNNLKTVHLSSFLNLSRYCSLYHFRKKFTNSKFQYIWQRREKLQSCFSNIIELWWIMIENFTYTAF